jgi:hypothetical protein
MLNSKKSSAENRLVKIKDGLVYASIDGAYNIILAAFDSLPVSTAAVVIASTEFSVSTAQKTIFSIKDGEKKRQISRAYIFLLNLSQAMLNDDFKVSSDQTIFENLWRKQDLHDLTSMLKGVVAANFSVNVTTLETEPALIPVPPSPQRPIFSPDLLAELRFKGQESSITNTLEAAKEFEKETLINQTALKLISLKGDLLKVLLDSKDAFTLCHGQYLHAQTAAYNDFAELFNKNQAEYNFKITLASKAIKAMAVIIPPPINLALVPLSKLVKQLHADSLTIGFEPAPKQPNPNPTIIDSVQENLASTKATWSTLTQIGENPKEMPTPAVLSKAMDDLVVGMMKDIEKVWSEEVNHRFGQGTGINDMRRKAEDITKKAMVGYKFGMVTSFSDVEKHNKAVEIARRQKTMVFMSEIDSHYHEVKTLLQSFTYSGLGDVQNWILVSLVADYAWSKTSQVFESDTRTTLKKLNSLGSVSFAPAFIDVLEKAGIVEKVKGNTSDFYNKSATKLPWNGSPNQRVAIFLYLAWARESLSPFRMLLSAAYRTQFEKASLHRIGRICEGIGNNRITHNFNHSTLNASKLLYLTRNLNEDI